MPVVPRPTTGLPWRAANGIVVTHAGRCRPARLRQASRSIYRAKVESISTPIAVDGETVGSISIGYGDPPQDDARLIEVAERYGVSLEKLRELSANMPSRPQFIVAVGKARLRSAAVLLGEIIKRKRAEEALADLTKNLEERIAERTEKLVHSQEQLRALATELNLAEQQ